MMYGYSAVNLKGKWTKGLCEAENENDLYKRVKTEGMFLVKSRVKESKSRVFFDSVDIKLISILCKQISALMRAGMDLTQSIAICSNECKKKTYRRSLKNVHMGILKGESLSDCLAKYPELYPKFMVDMAKIGESTGTLMEILNNLSLYYYKEMKLKNKIRTSLAYPMLLGACMIAVSFIVTTKIIPEFQGALSASGTELPAVTSMLISISRFCSNNIMLLAAIVILLIIALKYFLATSKGRRILSRIQIGLFPINRLFIRLFQIKITESMYVLLSSGHNPLKSLEICSGVLNNVLLRQKIFTCIEEIKRGRSFSKAMEGTEIFDTSFLSMVRIGEETGNIRDTIEEIIKMNEDNMEENINRVVVLIEPIMIIIAALIILFIVFAALLPTLNIMDSLGGQI